MHSCFKSSIFAARTLDFKVKFGFVFRSEGVVFRRYVLALLSVGLLRKFKAYLVYLSLIRSYFPRCFSFFQKFLHFTYMLLWFRLIIPSFPAQIDDMRSRFSALSHCRRRRRRRAYAPTSNTASHDTHEKINSWVSFCSLYGYGAPLGDLRPPELRYKSIVSRQLPC